MKFLLSLTFVFSVLQIFSQNKLISNGSYFEGEPYLAVDPQNQQHLVAAWMGYQLNNKIVIKSSVSMNGGSTWSTPIWQPHISTGYSSADVSLGFDNNGNLYMSYIDYDNVLFTGGKILVRKSTDGGISWGNPSEVTSISDCPGKLCIDRPWIAVDRSGTQSDGTIYVTSMNANQPTLITPPYNPYLAVSMDGGLTFSNPRTIDSTGFLAGSAITQPMPSPVVKSDGKFVSVYPSYLQSQSVFPRLILAESTNQGAGMTYKIAYQGVDFGASNQLLKSGPLLRSNPSNPNHLVFFFLSDLYDGSDIMMIETTDGGTNWSSFKRINQDTQGNGKLQDLVWGDFDNDGDLVVCWRDRRNANGNNYQVPTEIYATIRYKDSINFEPDFAISSMQVAHDTILEDNGNDFMHVAFENDTVYAVWGDVRSGTLKIYLNKWNPLSNTSSINEINTSIGIQIYPNPASDLLFLDFDKPIIKFQIINSEGKVLIDEKEFPKDGLNIHSLTSGNYFINCITENSTQQKQFSIVR